MAYIIKNTAGLINTRLTDVGRRYLSQGNFDIAYFQIGDSEVSYTALKTASPAYNQTNNNILMPAFNAQNDTSSPQTNKQNVKYPYYVQGSNGGTYGIPYMDSIVQPIYNSAGVKGFFMTGGTPGNWNVQTSSGYTITSNYQVDMGSLIGQTIINITLDMLICSPTTGTPSIGDIVTIIYDGNGSCSDVKTFSILTYKIQDLNPSTGTSGTTTWAVTLDRAVPNFTGKVLGGEMARVLVYPSKMTVIYDSITPEPYWETDAFNFESPCDISQRENTPIWNMNIPWTESPAGIQSNYYEDFTKYGSVSYIGTKEYIGYNNDSGQTDTSTVNYYNSYNEQIIVPPKNQKAIAIIHYTNQDIDNVYGEKFATTPFDPNNPTDNTGLAKHFKLTIPTLMWHKSSGTSIGQTFWIDPPGTIDFCVPQYIKSTENLDMNDPGIRYYQLWDNNPNTDGSLNRVGKVFPDQEIVVIDDEEIIAAMSYKSNRNWTLPAPKLSLLTPNVCSNSNTSSNPLVTNTLQNVWVTYRFDSTEFTESLHCNYYSNITSDYNSNSCKDDNSIPGFGILSDPKNVAVRFGPEFKFLNQPLNTYTSADLSGYSANSMKLLVQVVNGDTKPLPNLWKEIDVTSEISGSLINGYITMSGITGTTFQIDQTMYNNAPIYDLASYIDIPENGQTDYLNFGDEYYFYGNLETDISATIYEMKYLVNLNRNQFTNTSNPTWMSGTTSYVTEIGLYNNQKDLMVVSKLQSPQLRQGIQQFVVKLDF
jgi:hypothetical protein